MIAWMLCCWKPHSVSASSRLCSNTAEICLTHSGLNHTVKCFVVVFFSLHTLRFFLIWYTFVANLFYSQCGYFLWLCFIPKADLEMIWCVPYSCFTCDLALEALLSTSTYIYIYVLYGMLFIPGLCTQELSWHLNTFLPETLAVGMWEASVEITNDTNCTYNVHQLNSPCWLRWFVRKA